MLQVSGYLGGTVGLSSQQADSLGLASGPFGTPVLMGETDLRYRAHGFSFQALGTVVSIPDAGSINRAYGNNTPQTAYGAYAEIAYDLLASAPALSPKQLIIFSRLEKLDLNARIPANGTPDPTLNQRHLVVGLTYLPISSIALKADVRFAHLGSPNASSVVVPGTVGTAGAANTTYINLGIGFAF